MDRHMSSVLDVSGHIWCGCECRVRALVDMHRRDYLLGSSNIWHTIISKEEEGSCS